MSADRRSANLRRVASEIETVSGERAQKEGVVTDRVRSGR